MTGLTRTDEQIIQEKIVEELTKNEVPASFPEHLITDECENSRRYVDASVRIDLRAIDCFTIDGPNAKELDDAVSLELTEGGYRLGVHIADVTAYVPHDSALSAEAEKRGTTFYFPGYTIPMFPSAISEQLCSLTAGADKKTITMFIDFDPDGNILNYEVCRSVIRSRVRGIYAEVNMLLEDTADAVIREKYESVAESIINMGRLAEILHEKRARCGASVGSLKEYKYTFAEEMLELSVCGETVADQMICEFMVAANTCMAYYFEENNLPGMYRVQKDTSLNARYSTEQHNHESLAIYGGYLRFTSPIRRAADYKVHQVLAAFLDGESAESLQARYFDELTAYCGKAQSLEERAKRLERKILNECHMLYFMRHADDTFKGIIVGTSRGSGDVMIALQPYNIVILGGSVLSKYIGQEFLVKVMVDVEKNRLCVGHISRASAA